MTPRFLCLLVAVALGTIASLAGGQTSTLGTGALESRLDRFLEDTGTPAAGAAVVRLGDEPIIAVAGVREVAGPPVEMGDLWHIGSITKSFTATLTARLIAAGTPLHHRPRSRLQWDTPLSALLPKAAESAYADVTIRQLLGMRGGLPANPSAARFSTRDSTTPVRQQRRAVVEEILGTEPTSEPGSAFLYSNASYIVIGAALEETLDDSWENLLRKHVLQPLELNSAGFGAPGSKASVDQPRGHLGTSNEQLRAIPPSPTADNPSFLGPAGTLHMTLDDLIRYAAMHLQGALGDETFLGTEQFRNLHVPLDGHAYASGWIRIPPSEEGRLSGPVLFHNGSNTLWYAVVMFAPDHRTAAVVTTNAGVQNRTAVDSLTRELLAGGTTGEAPAPEAP